MERGLFPLLTNVANAFNFSPLNYPRSLLGDPKSWSTKYCEHTELKLIEPNSFPQNVKTISRILLPAWPGTPTWWPEPLESLGLTRDSKVLPYPVGAEPAVKFDNESWLFLNGICTDESVAYLNAEYLYQLFGRPLTLLHNQTHSMFVDLFECGLGKGWGIVTEAVRALFPAFYSELKRPDISRVVLIGHSQGTILCAVFLALLRKLIGQTIKTPDSHEEALADKLLSFNRAEWDKSNVRAMVPKAGQTGSRIVPLSNAPVSNPIAAWLDWGEDELLGLPPLTASELHKLEIFCFATCATDLRYIVADGVPSPYIEHFGNKMDGVARMGLYAPESGPGATFMSGQCFLAEKAWGHFLNAHYLELLERQWRDQQPHFKPKYDHLVQESRLAQAYRQVHAH